MSYQIPNTELELNLTVVDSERLHLHEHVVSDHVDRLVEAIRGDGELRDPVIVDRDTGVVLDGMHRFTVLKQLGYEVIPVCEIPYTAEEVAVGSWVKIYESNAYDHIVETASELDIGPVTAEEPDTATRPEPCPVIETVERTAFLDIDATDLTTYLPAINRFFARLLDGGFEPRLIPDVVYESARPGEVVIRQPMVDKDTVIEAARNGVPFPPNTSRHIIPTRPVGVDVPLRLLEHDAIEASRHLDDYLAGRDVHVLERGSSHKGRTYEEELVVFD